jgi:Domain of unknown function (DUF5625)
MLYAIHGVYQRRTMTCLAAILPLFAQWAIAMPTAEVSTEVLLPPFSINWSVAPNNNSVSQLFNLREYRYCNFEIAFQRDGPRTVESLLELEKLTGDGKTVWVTKDSADAEDPVVFSDDSPEGLRRLEEGKRRGDYLARMQRSGVMIPVHLEVEAVSDGAPATKVFDKVVRTWNFAQSSVAGINRSITWMKLRPGTYRIRASTIQVTPLPLNVHTYLVVGYPPKSRALRPDE